MNADSSVELTRPDLSNLEIQLVVESLTSTRIGGGDKFSELARAELREALGCADVILTTSGTDALELCALLLGLGPGDVAVLPSFTFASVATAFARTGALLRFADIEADTLGLDPISLQKNMDERVKAVVPVHYGGMACDLDGIQNVLTRYEGAVLVEDNAHGLFGSFRGRALGTFGPVGMTSFHVTKNLVAGEGGAVFINDASLVRRAHVLSEKGTDRREFLAGMVDKYTWRDIGSSFLLADPLAALLYGQLQRRAEINEKREQLFQAYRQLLNPYSGLGKFRVPTDRLGWNGVRHLFYVLCESESERDRILATLKNAGIGAAFHYVPLHSAPAAKRFTEDTLDCPVAESVSQRLVRLPLHSGMELADVERVCTVFFEAVTAHG